MKFVVAHNGARRGYAVPSILESAGLLEAFYTDICGDVGFGKLVRAISKFTPPRSRLRRLAGRRLPANLLAKTQMFVHPTLADYFAQRRRRDAVEAYRAHLRWQCELGNRMAERGLGNADWLHAFLDEFPTLIKAAKKRGLKVVSEVYILLSSDRIMREERKAFPRWEPAVPDFDAIYREMIGERVLITESDYLLCPSQAVANDAEANFGFAKERMRIVPYGVSNSWFDIINSPTPARVLFAGSAELRKGIHYLALAAEKLKSQRYDFRVAGDVHSSIVNQRISGQLNFLGRIPRDEIADEFENADVFVLPSLAEGSAGVTYEALAAGVPVIATPEAGSVVRDGVEGRIIPSRDADALAAAIAELVEDRAKRNKMAVAARQRAKEFTWEKYGERLVSTLRAFPS